MNSGRIEMIKTTAQRSIYQIKVEGSALLMRMYPATLLFWGGRSAVLPDGVQEFRGTTQPCSFMYQKSLNDLPEEFPLDESITSPWAECGERKKKRVAYIIHYWRGDWVTQGEWKRGGNQKSRRASASLHATPSRARPALPDFLASLGTIDKGTVFLGLSRREEEAWRWWWCWSQPL